MIHTLAGIGILVLVAVLGALGLALRRIHKKGL